MTSYEDVVRAWAEADRAHRAGFRKFLAAQHSDTKLDKDTEGALWSRYNVEHRAEADRVDTLSVEVAVLKAELERRWIEAHEDLRLYTRGVARQ